MTDIQSVRIPAKTHTKAHYRHELVGIIGIRQHS